MTAPADLTRARRDQVLDRLADTTYDVVVVGGGVTGAGTALDAASRGLRTLLVERVDLAAGTSRWSSKLVHGGLRYLAKGDVAVAWESSRERHHLMTCIAPHLTRAATYLVPLDANTTPAMGAVTEAGLRFADAMRAASHTPAALLPRPHRLDRETALLLAPGLRRAGLRGALSYADGQSEDDARLVVALARTAAAHGADILTRCAATDVDERALTVTDVRDGTSWRVGGTVIAAAGVWAGDHEPSIRVTPSRGTHLVVRAEAVGHPRAIFTAPVPGHFGRFVFALPQTDGLVLIGLTDEPAVGADGIAPPVPIEDEEFLLATMNLALERPLTAADVVGRFAGLRPLLTPTAADAGGRSAEGPVATSDVSRKHLLVEEPGRPLTIAGGKLTTYRRMAQDAVDAACRRLDLDLPCRTQTLPLVGAAPRALLRRVAAPERLVRRYGTEAPRVLRLAEGHPELAQPIAPGLATIGAELLFGILAEGALTEADLVERRTRASFVEEAIPAATAAARHALELAAAPVG